MANSTEDLHLPRAVAAMALLLSGCGGCHETARRGPLPAEEQALASVVLVSSTKLQAVNGDVGKAKAMGA